MMEKIGFVIVVKDVNDYNKAFDETKDVNTMLYVSGDMGTYVDDITQAIIWESMDDLIKSGGNVGGIIPEVIQEIEYVPVVIASKVTKVINLTDV